MSAGVEADVGAGDVVGDDEVAALAGELVAGVGLEVFGFGGEADEGAREAEFAAGGAEDVGVADQFEGEGVGGLLDLVPGDLGRAVVGDGGGEDGDVARADVVADGVEHLGGGFDREEIDARPARRGWSGRRPAATWWPLAGGGGGEGVAHAAGRAVGQVADRVDGFAGRAGGDEELHAPCWPRNAPESRRESTGDQDSK